MKFFTAVVSAAAVASAATIGKRDTVFAVSEFSAGVIAHSTQALYSFKVLQSGSMETTGVTCNALVSSNTDGTLPDVPAGTCQDSSRTFTVVRQDDGLLFTVSQPVTPSSNQTGSYLIPSSDLNITNEPNAVRETYTGPTTLDLA